MGVSASNGFATANGECVDCELAALAETKVPALPPLPPPDLETMRSEATVGVSLVLFLIGMFVSLTYAFTMPLDLMPRLMLRAGITVEAVVAVGCLAGILLGDPGVVERSPRTCAASSYTCLTHIG